VIVHKLIGGGKPPDYVEKRYCPKDEGHWKVDEPNGRCPVCRSKIETALYIYAGVVDEDDVHRIAAAAIASERTRP
jgi:hypothetical protein